MSDTIANPYDREAAERAVNHVPPHSLQLERAVLGLMLLSPAATDEIIASDLRPGGDAGALGSERGLYTLVPYTDPQALLKGAGTGKLKPKS